jgi:hypothetical protein
MLKLGDSLLIMSPHKKLNVEDNALTKAKNGFDKWLGKNFEDWALKD